MICMTFFNSSLMFNLHLQEEDKEGRQKVGFVLYLKKKVIMSVPMCSMLYKLLWRHHIVEVSQMNLCIS